MYSGSSAVSISWRLASTNLHVPMALLAVYQTEMLTEAFHASFAPLSYLLEDAIGFRIVVFYTPYRLHATSIRHRI